MTAAVDSLYRGFRENYLDYETLTAQLKAWAEAFPDIVRLESLATTREGRELWLLTIGPEPDRDVIAGRQGLIYQRGPAPDPDDIDGRLPAVITWHDGAVHRVVASAEPGTTEQIDIAMSIYG